MKSRPYHRILAVVLTVAMTMTSLPAAAVAEMADDVSAAMSSSQMSEASDASGNADASSQQSEVSEEAQCESSAESVPTEQAQPEQAQPEQTQSEVTATEGTATEGTALSSAQDLQGINNNLSGSYYLTQDIDLTGVSFTPIGSKATPFTGTFDGNGHKVTNLAINNSFSLSYQGLFGCVDKGTIKNVGVTGSVGGNSYVGGIAGFVDGGTIENCYSEATVTGCYSYIGGVTGYLKEDGRVENCYNTGKVIGGNEYYFGGVVGCAFGNVSNCYNTGAVTGDYVVGGVIGEAFGSVSDCHNTGEITGKDRVGGVAGCIDESMRDCYNTGAVTGSDFDIGGVIGKLYQGEVTDCYNTGAVTATISNQSISYVGGVIGEIGSDVTVINCYNTGSVYTGDNSGDYTGGVIGGEESHSNMGTTTVTNCYNTGAVTGSRDTGGVIGAIHSTITGCYNIGTVNGCGSCAGGVAGYAASNSEITNCYNTGKVSLAPSDWFFTTYAFVGGVAGEVDKDGRMSDCDNTGEVCASDFFDSLSYVGGVAGIVYGEVKNSYNTGALCSDHTVGGVAGEVAKNGEVSDCYNTGGIVCSGDVVGGVAGIVYGEVKNSYNIGGVVCSGATVGGVTGAVFGSVENCYYNTDNAGNATQAIGSGSADESVCGVTLQQMLGSNALESMIFTSAAGTWVTLNTTTPDENGLYYVYFPQLSVFVADSANPKPEEMVSISLTAEVVDLANGSVTLSSRDGGVQVKQGGDTHCIAGISVCITDSDVSSNTITIDSSFQNNGSVILKDVNISASKSGIKVSKKANVEFVLKGSNSVTSTSCKKRTDSAAIEVPGGATATFSGEGTLNATAQGYGAAIGAKGYYRDGLDHADDSKSSGIVNIKGSAHVVATSAYGAGIGGGAINGNTCAQKAFDNGEVYISEDAVVEATCTDGYSAGIGGGGCYTSTCESYGGDGGIVEISGNAQVTAKCTGFLGAGIGGGGACAKVCTPYGGDEERFVSKDNAVVYAYGADYAPGIGGGGSEAKNTNAFYSFPGNGGEVILQGNTVVTADGGLDAAGVGAGKYNNQELPPHYLIIDPIIQKEDTATLNNL